MFQSDHGSIYASAGGELLCGDNRFPGRFDERSTEIIEALLDDCTLSLQVVLSPEVLRPTMNRKMVPRMAPNELPASLIVYGPMNAHESVGNFFQECELYLQDPIGCDKNVPYCNPHRFGFASDPLCMTFDLRSSQMHAKVTTISSHDMFDTIFSSVHLSECDTPSMLRTSLLPYVSPPLPWRI